MGGRRGCGDAERLSRSVGLNAPEVHRVSFAAVLGVVGLALFGLACAGSGGGVGQPAPPPLVRPELGPEYDVLVAELAARDGDYAGARSAFTRALEKDPSSAHLHFRLAHLAAQSDDLSRSLEWSRRGVELAPGDLEGRLFLSRLYLLNQQPQAVVGVLTGDDGTPINSEAALILYQIYFEEGRFQAALEVAQGLQASEPDFLGAAMAVAAAYESMGRFAEAEGALQQARVEHPERIVIYSRLARMRRSQGDRAGEIALYREILAERPAHYGTLLSLGEALIAENQIDQAIATYEELAEIFPDDLQILRRLASLEFGSGRYEDAARRLQEAALRHPDRFELTYSLGQVLRALGRVDEAMEVFDSVPLSHPLYFEARMQIAIQHEDNADFLAALEEVEALRALRPGRGMTFQVSLLRARSGDFEGGAALLEEMLAEDPDDVEVLYQLAVLYGSQKEIDQALFYMTQVLKHDPQNAQALNYVGYTWVERGQNLDRAEALIERAVRLSPRDGYIVDSLGWVYYMRARPLIGGPQRVEGLELLEKAIAQLILALELTGGDPVVSEHLGDVYLLLDEPRRALDYYEQAVAMDPRLEEQPNLREKIETLRRELGSSADGEASEFP